MRGIRLVIAIVLLLAANTTAQRTMSYEREQALKLIESAGIQHSIIGFSSIRTLTPHLKASAEMLQVVAISFEGPYDGYLVLLNQNDSVLNVKRTGFIKTVSLNSLNTYRDFIICDVIQGSGALTRLDKYIVFTVNDNRLNYSWMETSYELSAPGNLAPAYNYEIKTYLEFDDVNNDRVLDIIYHGKRIVYDTASAVKWEKQFEKVYLMNRMSYTFEEQPAYSKNPLSMPKELYELAQKRGFEPLDESNYQYFEIAIPPYVYGYKKNLLFYNSVAFWAAKLQSKDSKAMYFLVFAERKNDSADFLITDTLESTYPKGLNLYEDSAAVLDSFVYVSDYKTPGPKAVKLKDYGVESYYDGNSDIYYQHNGKLLVRFDWDI